MSADPQPLPKDVLPFFIRYIKRSWPPYLGIFLLPLVWSVVTAFNPYLLKMVIDRVVDHQPEVSSLWTAVAPTVLLFVLVQFCLDFAMRWEEYLTVTTVPDTKAEMRSALFDYTQLHSHAYFQDNLSGSLSNKILDLVRSYEIILHIVSFNFAPIILTAAISVCLMWSIRPEFGIFTLTWFIAYTAVTYRFGKKCIPISKAHSQANSVLSGKLVDAFRNIATVRLFGRRRQEHEHLLRYQNDEVAKSKILGVSLLKIHIFQGLASTALFSGALLLFLYGWSRDWVTVGDFTYVMTTAFNLLLLTWWLSDEFMKFFKEYGVAKQALSLMTTPHGVMDQPNAPSLAISGGSIRFNDVTFCYIPGKNIFQDKNVVIGKGEKVGLVGFSGSGKSTFINLILRYFDVESGSISIDGQDISRVSQESLRSQISVIPQDTSLFHRSLMENIRYGRPAASDEEVFAAAKQAHCHAFIQLLDEGYETIVGEGGIKLSGGQRQRIAIARAILKDAPILILDEATSALDSATENQIHACLSDLMKDRTTIAIAHRLSTLGQMDRILVFEEGSIVENGTHQQLLDKNGHYATLWQLQTDGYIPTQTE